MKEGEGRKFHIGDLLSWEPGFKVSPEGMSGILEMAKYMTGDETLFDYQLARIYETIRYYVVMQHQWLEDVDKTGTDEEGFDFDSWVERLAEEHGEEHEVFPIHHEDYEHIDQTEEFKKHFPEGNAFVFGGDVQEEDAEDQDNGPSPYGDINWKVDDSED